MPAMSISANLKRLRALRKLSQPKLAEAAGVSQQLISQIERGENASTKCLPALAKALGVSVEEIDLDYRASEGGTHPTTDPDLTAFLEIYDRLPVQARKAILATARAFADRDSEQDA